MLTSDLGVNRDSEWGAAILRAHHSSVLRSVPSQDRLQFLNDFRMQIMQVFALAEICLHVEQKAFGFKV